jgi:hypothetical protein
LEVDQYMRTRSARKSKVRRVPRPRRLLQRPVDRPIKEQIDTRKLRPGWRICHSITHVRSTMGQGISRISIRRCTSRRAIAVPIHPRSATYIDPQPHREIF